MRSGLCIALLCVTACGASHHELGVAEDGPSLTGLIALPNGNCVARDGHTMCWGLVGVDESRLELRGVFEIQEGESLCAASGESVCVRAEARPARCLSPDGETIVGPGAMGPMRSSASFTCSADEIGLTCALHSEGPGEVVALPIATGDTWSMGMLGDLCIHRTDESMLDCIVLATHATRTTEIPWPDIELLAGGMLEGAASHGARILIWGSRTGGTPSAPVEWDPHTPVREVAIGPSLGCALLDNGEVYCWGSNGCDWVPGREPLPVVSNSCDAGVYPRPTPQPLPGAATHLVVGVRHACAALTDQSVWCWGSNYLGQLGDGTRADSTVPVLVLGIDARAELGGSP